MPVLEMARVQKSFLSPDGGSHRVIDVDVFALEESGQVALRGESGSGKTTFLNLIAGILKPDSGTISINGRELSALSEPERDRLRATTIGYIFQSFNLLQGYTCLENVLLGMSFGRGVDRAFAATVLDRVGLSNRLNHRPGQLSTGQQQRVAVARALANRPKLVLADEPTGNLDHRNARESLASGIPPSQRLRGERSIACPVQLLAVLTALWSVAAVWNPLVRGPQERLPRWHLPHGRGPDSTDQAADAVACLFEGVGEVSAGFNRALPLAFLNRFG